MLIPVGISSIKWSKKYRTVFPHHTAQHYHCLHYVVGPGELPRSLTSCHALPVFVNERYDILQREMSNWKNQLRIGFNGVYLHECLKAHKGEVLTIKANTGTDGAIFSSGNLSVLLLPVRLRE